MWGGGAPLWYNYNDETWTLEMCAGDAAVSNNRTNTVSNTSQYGRVGWWKFDGTLTDSSGHNGHGLAIGAVEFGSDRFGRPLSSLKLTGGSLGPYVFVQNSSHLLVPWNVTVSAWFLDDPSLPNHWHGRIIASGGDRTDGYELTVPDGDSTSIIWVHEAQTEQQRQVGRQAGCGIT